VLADIRLPESVGDDGDPADVASATPEPGAVPSEDGSVPGSGGGDSGGLLARLGVTRDGVSGGLPPAVAIVTTIVFLAAGFLLLRRVMEYEVGRNNRGSSYRPRSAWSPRTWSSRWRSRSW